jgi:hypothetical protein
MVTNFLKNTLKRFGYELNHITQVKVEQPGYVLYNFLDQDGSFDYERYRLLQEEGNKRKISLVWVIEENIEFLADYIRKSIPEVGFGLCHGTRRGKEQEWFKKYLNCDVIGTEISNTAQEFPDTIQWDFHEAKSEWIGAVDFIYSNSFDHSYDPEKCLNTWMSCLKPDGICIIEHSSLHAPKGTSALDPFGADLFLMPYLIVSWSQGKYGVKEILQAPKKSESLDQLHFIVIQKFA